MLYPELNVIPQYEINQQVFAGYDHNVRGRDGTFYDMRNMSMRNYPLLSSRKPRRSVQTMMEPGGLIAKDALYWVDDGAFYANGLAVAGLTLTAGEKQLVSMGAYIVIWPDKKYINTQDLSDFGSIDHAYEYTGDVALSLCRQSGEDYDLSNALLSPTAPENPANGDLWIDTSGEKHSINQYSEATGEWAVITTVYVRISAPGIGAGFSAFDGVNISGLTYSGEDAGLAAQVNALNAASILEVVDDDYIVMVGMLDQEVTVGAVTVSRQSPDMDYICEANNRLWGCFYGMKDGKAINEIYACKLGDFKNWNCFMGLSTDSYTVSLGTDGVFTGAAHYQGYPVFFKETCLHKIYGTQPSSFQLQTMVCRGVQEGSHRSLCQVGEVLYYKGRTEVLAYDGSIPQAISQPLGDERYSAGVGGSIGGLYYLNVLDWDNNPIMLVYDTQKVMWTVEDGVRPIAFAQLDDDLYMLTENALMAVSGGDEVFSWRFETGNMGYEYPQQKYLSRWMIRAAAALQEHVRVSFMYDSSGTWEPAGEIIGQGMTRILPVPVIPRRCDHMAIRIEGEGEFKLFSLSRVIEKGGDPI